MTIKLYEDRYQQDLIEMIREARVALGLNPTVRSDLYDITKNYFEKGDLFWIALDEWDQVIGCLGYSRIGDTEAFLHRFYVKASMKRQGVGTALLETAETEMRQKGILIAKVHLGGPKETWFESYSFYPKHGYIEYAPRYLMKQLRPQLRKL